MKCHATSSFARTDYQRSNGTETGFLSLSGIAASKLRKQSLSNAKIGNTLAYMSLSRVAAFVLKIQQRRQTLRNAPNLLVSDVNYG